MNTGPRLVNDNLKVAYDTGYGIANNDTATRFYPGEPTSNLLLSTEAFDNTSHWARSRNSGSAPTVTANTSPNPLGGSYTSMADKLYIPDDGTYPRIAQSFTPAGTGTHTFSVWMRSLSGTCGIFLGIFRNSPWSLPGSTSIADDQITTEWKRFSLTFNPADTSSHQIYIGAHDAAAHKGNTIELWGAQIEYKSHTTPYTSSARAQVEGLLDLKGNQTVDPSNMSFDSTGQPEFDGTNDFISFTTDVTIADAGQGWTAEYVFNTDSASTLQHFNSAEADSENSNWLALYQSYLQVWDHGQNTWKKGSTVFSSNTWYHIAFVQETGTSMQFYVNGVAESGDHVSWSWTASRSALISRYVGKYEYNNGHSRYFNGHIPVARLYSNPLTAAEIKQNFNVFKNRFNI